MVMKIRFNPDKKVVKSIREAVRKNDGYCPCSFVRSPDTKCMCRDFKQMTTPGFCHCRLYEKVGETYYTYILECSDGTFYTGATTDLDRRLYEHNQGVGAKYTRGRTPCKMVYNEESPSWSAALQREIQIKKLSREQKFELIERGKK